MKFYNFKVNFTYLIDLSNQVSGIYLLKVIIDNQQYIEKLIMRK